MALVLAYGFFSTWTGDYSPPPAATTPSGTQPACKDGLTQYCKVGNCSGLSTCVGGAWGGCKWERVCTSGSKAPCLKNNCPYALKECNECGTGFGPCVGGNAS
jgi:hypothetical protein